MKALIVALNAKYVHASLAPWYLKGAAREAGLMEEGWQVEILESNINRPAAETADRILEAKPDLLAFCCYIWNMNRIEEILGELEGRLSDCRILLGGPEVSFDAPERLGEPGLKTVDFILCGEGEESFPLLLKIIAAGNGKEAAGEPKPWRDFYAQVPGLCYRRRGKIEANPVREPAADPPDPYSPEFLEQLNGRIVYLETSRGCPFRCGFCLSGRPGNTRFFDLERAKRQILLLANSGSRTIKLVDRTFNCQPRRAAEVIAFILEHSAAKAPGPEGQREEGKRIPPGVCFHLEVAADLFTEETLALLAQAPQGLFQLEIGLQSFREETLAAVSRRTDLVRVEENFRRLASFGNMHLHLDLIAGLPGEDLASFADSFDRAFALRPHMLQLGFLKLLRGSRLRAEAEATGTDFEERPPYTVRSTPWLTAAELEELKLCEDALDRLYNSGRFPRTVEYLLTASGLRPFELFFRFGHYVGRAVGIALEQYVSRIYSFGCGLAGTDRDRLRDALVQDWLADNNTGRLPQALQIPDMRYRQVSLALERLAAARQKAAFREKNALRLKDSRRSYGFGLLYGGGRVLAAVADYRQPRAFLGGYPLRLVATDAICAAAAALTQPEEENSAQR